MGFAVTDLVSIEEPSRGSAVPDNWPVQEPGEGFARADNTQLKKRKIFRARRAGQPAPTIAAAGAPAAVGSAGSNPFAGISLTPAAAGNPFAGVSLAAPAAQKVPPMHSKTFPHKRNN